MTIERPRRWITTRLALGDLAPAIRWSVLVVLGTASAAVVAALWSGVAGLLVGIATIAGALAGDFQTLVQSRSRGLREAIDVRLGEVRIEHADAAVQAGTHDPFAFVKQLLGHYRAPTAAVQGSLRAVDQALDVVLRRLGDTHARRLMWAAAGAPELIGGLAGTSRGLTVRYYGDPALLPAWLRGRHTRAGALRLGRILDDIRLLNTAQTESMVLGFTLWARALLLVLAPSLAALSSAPPPSLDACWCLVPWLLAVVWAVGTALVAPRVAALVMAESAAGLRARRGLLAVELPLAIALALTTPGWPAVVFAAGWTHWWVRIGPTPAIPDFSWARAAVWAVVTAATQVAGLAATTTGGLWPEAVTEVAITLGVVVLIADTYGAMLPVYGSVAVQILFTGARQQRAADADARRVLADVAAAMRSAADGIDGLPDRTAADEDARDVLRREGDRMLSPPARRRRGTRELGEVMMEALAEGGFGLWTDDPRAIAARERAHAEGGVEPVAVNRPHFESTDLAHLILPVEVSDPLHRLLAACIIEARIHGTRQVQTIVCRRGDGIEVRIANRPDPGGTPSGGGQGGRDITRLARSLPGAGEVFRGLTDRSFIGADGHGALFGVRFTFTVRDTASRGERPGLARPGL